MISSHSYVAFGGTPTNTGGSTSSQLQQPVISKVAVVEALFPQASVTVNSTIVSPHSGRMEGALFDQLIAVQCPVTSAPPLLSNHSLYKVLTSSLISTDKSDAIGSIIGVLSSGKFVIIIFAPICEVFPQSSVRK